MESTIRVFSGRTFSSKDIEMIQWIIKTYKDLSLRELAATICEALDWLTPAGRPKTTQCVEFLTQLESENIVKLPKKKQANRRPPFSVKEMEFDTTEIKGKLSSFEPLVLTAVKTTEERQKWKAYVNQYHMLGYKQEFGSRIQYFIKSGDKELGCLQFSASSWALASRDQWINWSIEDKKARLHLIVNNSRYLIFPWVRIDNLASKALSLASRQIQKDWLREFCYAPVLIETFVDTEHFLGTCYKAANWIYLGKTQGRGRNDRDNEYSLSKKDIYVYPLQKDFRECLRGEKAYKVVNPDEQ